MTRAGLLRCVDQTSARQLQFIDIPATHEKQSQYRKGGEERGSVFQSLIPSGKDGAVAGTVTILTDGGLGEAFVEDGANVITERVSTGPFPQLCIRGSDDTAPTLVRSRITTYLRETPASTTTTTTTAKTPAATSTPRAAALPHQLRACPSSFRAAYAFDTLYLDSNVVVDSQKPSAVRRPV